MIILSANGLLSGSNSSEIRRLSRVWTAGDSTAVLRNLKVLAFSANPYLHFMSIRPKSAYHPYLVVAFYLNCLPVDLLQRIPKSTRYEWLHKDQATLFGYDWYLQNQSLFKTLQQVVAHKRLLQINRALLRVIVLKRFIQLHAHRIKDNIYNINKVVLNNLCKITAVMGLRITLKYLRQSYSWYLQLRRKQKCNASLFSLCRIKHPAQLLVGEINTIKAYCSNTRLLHWPLASVYHQMRKDRAATLNISTFYKYVALLQLKRSSPGKRRKNHHTGIRADAPLKILHADTTIFRTADNLRNYIYLIQDNFSRAILSYQVARECKAQNVFDNLNNVHQQYLSRSVLDNCKLITDDGSENLGSVTTWINSSASPSVQHLVAQRDIEFSNSMIEAANKQLKYRFLYHYYIPDHNSLVKYIQDAVQDYNHRPHAVLNGLTPFEVLNGQNYDKAASHQQIAIAKYKRMVENKTVKCCYYSF